MSAESGIPTFRGAGGLWRNHRFEDLASPEGWRRNPELVLEFYNQRRRQILQAQPNEGHRILSELEKQFDVTIITQNIDNLHESAGSSRVIHLHGLITQSRSSIDPELVYEIDGWQIRIGDRCERGSQLRPNIVWFGEPVPMIDLAVEWARKADVFVVVGTSLVVYPAAGLIDVPPPDVPKFVIDPDLPNLSRVSHVETIAEPASRGLATLLQRLNKM